LASSCFFTVPPPPSVLPLEKTHTHAQVNMVQARLRFCSFLRSFPFLSLHPKSPLFKRMCSAHKDIINALASPSLSSSSPLLMAKRP
jgi:hypothetical protein